MGGDSAETFETRAARARLVVPEALKQSLLAYFELLSRWNEKINLTSLSDPDLAIDRLLLEPLAAGAHLPRGAKLIDLGSGGGSPAIPLALALSASALVLVESRARKAAFLREAIRELGLPAVVESVRFEDLARDPKYHRSADVVSIRGIRMDGGTLETAAEFLNPSGVIALFTSVSSTLSTQELRIVQETPLIGNARLLKLKRPDSGRST